ncbi:hypothetical protein N7462_002965 [Penicillium macrosclerotiorum]|uniref:uncharacterized protein n=1 Tax=Penicillium macrosclerotiorum TaxID=303699 RepID=UPI0025485D1B|nr:uncharacterized protein N7462_002965 [Penicillium macrosclerotiorum]KAJ5688573.1 hypothetical protein N7462_002965 [Penicillium macrosclerotiorum]
MFTSAAMGILVDQGKLQWQDPVQKYLPDFCPIGDPQIGQSADIIDLLRHSTGLGNIGPLCLGPGATILMDEDDMIPLLNMASTANKRGQRFNREWGYNNIAYGIVARVIEKVSGQRFDQFVQQHILLPLGMDRTMLRTADVEMDDNVAIPCVALGNGQYVELTSQSWPCENNSPLLAATGIRSSMNDMLKWCMAVLSAEREEQSIVKGEKPVGVSTTLQKACISNKNPLKQMTRIRRGYWTRPADDPSTSKDAAYCMGWIRMSLPSSMLGAFSGNGLTREKGRQLHVKPDFILGKGSDPFLTIGHSGGMAGSLATVWTFPKSQSAVIVMANGRSFGDATDFVSQILIQALFELKPEVDLVPWVAIETNLAQSYFVDRLLMPWAKNRCLDDIKRTSSLYVGHYQGFGDLFTLEIGADENGELSVIFNNRQTTRCPLVFFRTDVYSFFIEDRDTWMTRAIFAKSYEDTLLEFELDKNLENVTGLWWLWNPDEERGWFKKV